MKVNLIKTFGSFKPADSESEELIRKIKLNEIREFTVVKKRIGIYHKKYFKMISLIQKNQDEYSMSEFLTNIKIKLKMYTVKYDFDGVPYPEFKSISYDKMDQFEFEDVYSKTLDFLLKWVNRNVKIDEQKLTISEVEEALLKFM